MEVLEDDSPYREDDSRRRLDECTDTNYDSDGNELSDSEGDPCSDYYASPGWCNNYDTAEFISGEMCCACGGGEIASDP